MSLILAYISLETFLRPVCYFFIMIKNELSGFYTSFLLRIWCEIVNGDLVWRASLENPATGERTGYASIDLLLEYLKRIAEKDQSAQEQEGANEEI